MVKNLNNRVRILAILLLALIGVSGILLSYFLSQQSANSAITNMLAEQNMLSQRITKLTLLIHRDILEDTMPRSRPDSLTKLIPRWNANHQWLVKNNLEYTGNDEVIQKCDSLLSTADVKLKTITQGIERYFSSRTLITAQQAAAIADRYELPYHALTKVSLDYYKQEERRVLSFIKIQVWITAIMVVIAIVSSYLFVLKPAIDNIVAGHKKLDAANQNLEAANTESWASLNLIKKLQVELAERELQYRTLVEDAPDIIYELDGNGKFSFINKTAEKIIGFSKSEILDKHFWEMFPDSMAEDLAKQYIDFVKKGLPSVYHEVPIKTNTNAVIWMGQNIQFTYHNNWLTRARVLARDITQLREARQEVIRERLLLRTIIDIIPANIYAKNSRGQKILANKAEWQYLGASSEEDILGETDFDRYSEDAALAFHKEDEFVMAGNTLLNKESHYQTTTGEVRWLLISKAPLLNDQQKIVGLVGVSIDITSRKKIEQSLAVSEERYRLITENSSDVISVHSLDGTFLFVSPSCKKLHGYTAEELLGKLSTDLIHPEDLKLIDGEDPFNQLRDGKTIGMEFRIRTKSGKLVWAESKVTPLFKNLEVSGFQAALRDISARKEAEENLIAARSVAEQATKDKSQFLAVMSHEIRTPLNGVIGLVNILAKNNPRDDQRDWIRHLKFSADSLMTLINDVLDFSKIEAGKLHLEAISFNLVDLLNQTCDLLAHRAGEKGLEIQRHFKSINPVIKGDPARLLQILSNLISNAIKFTEKGFIRIEMAELISVRSNFIECQFSIIDTGIGIPKENLQSIFEKFNQATKDTTRKYGGTGLGLNISNQLVNKMGGKLGVNSEIGKGAEFYFTLQFEIGNDELAPHKNAQEETISASGLILLVDDDQVNRVVASQYLSDWGFEVVTAVHGADALEKLKTVEPVLILMDIQMPVMDGFEATKQIRALSGMVRNTPVVGLTATLVSEIKESALMIGFNEIIAKPFLPEILLNTITKFINQGVGPDILAGLSKNELYMEQNSAGQNKLKALMLQNFEELVNILGSNDSATIASSLHKNQTGFTLLNNPEILELSNKVAGVIKSKQQAPNEFIEPLKHQLIQAIQLLRKNTWS